MFRTQNRPRLEYCVFTLVMCAGLIFQSGPAHPRGEIIAGPVQAKLLKVIDGDTVRVRAKIWLGQEITVTVRLADIDAPELNSRNPQSRELAEKARNALVQMASYQILQLKNIRRGKYAGRIIAELILPDGSNISNSLLDMGFVRPYKSRRTRKRRSLCMTRRCRASHESGLQSAKAASPQQRN